MPSGKANGIVSLDFTDAGFEEVITTMTVLSERVSTVGLAMKIAAAEYTAIVEKAFANEARPSGQRWTALKDPQTIKARNSEFKNGYSLYGGDFPKLKRTEALFNAATGGFKRIAAEAGPSTTFFVLHVDVPYAFRHQYGDGRTPARPFIPSGIQMEQILHWAANDWINGKFNKNAGEADYTAYSAYWGV